MVADIDPSVTTASSPCYSAACPNRKANTSDRAWRRKSLTPVSRESIEGAYCQQQQRRCEWLECALRSRKCGWFGDELLVQKVGNLPRKCPECVDSPDPVPGMDSDPRV